MFTSVPPFAPSYENLSFVQVATLLSIWLYVSDDADPHPDRVPGPTGPRTIPFLLSVNCPVKQRHFRSSLQRNFWRKHPPSKECTSRRELNFPSLFDVISRCNDRNCCLIKDVMNTKDGRSEHLNEPGCLTTLLS